MKYFYSLLLFILFHGNVYCAGPADSVRLAGVREKLVALTERDPAYLSEVDVSVGRVSLSELLRNIAKINRVSLSVKNDTNLNVSCNFSRARLDELLLFLCREYDLDIDVVGNIVSIYPFVPVPDEVPLPVVSYIAGDSLLSYDLIDASLPEIAKRISALSGINLAVPRTLYEKKISGYVSRMPLGEALYTLASVNDLYIEQGTTGVWTFFQATETDDISAPETSYVRRRRFEQGQLAVDSLGRISASIDQGNVYDIILDVCDRLELNHFFITPVNARIGIFIKQADVKTFFDVLFTGTPYSYYEEGGVYVFGKSSAEEALVSTRTIPLQYRAADKIAEAIPDNLKKGVQVKMFGDLNSVVVSGDQRQVARVEQFIRSIDKTVPLVTIDIIIADVSKERIDEAGVSLNKGGNIPVTGGTLSPGIDVNLGAASINSLINSFNGFGVVKLGKVSSDLYMNLKLMESNGEIALQSTPKLSTLNGHEASLSSGEMKYYKEVNNTYMGTQNPMQSTSYTWKNVEANLTIKITPFVSGDNQITLDIDIVQSEFTAREEKEAPPGTSTRSFKSLIRVQNEEVVLLGGIERNSREKVSGGLPGIARVPVLKWLFGTAKDNKSEHKLNVFIKPTIIR